MNGTRISSWSKTCEADPNPWLWKAFNARANNLVACVPKKIQYRVLPHWRQVGNIRLEQLSSFCKNDPVHIRNSNACYSIHFKWEWQVRSDVVWKRLYITSYEHIWMSIHITSLHVKMHIYQHIHFLRHAWICNHIVRYHTCTHHLMMTDIIYKLGIRTMYVS